MFSKKSLPLLKVESSNVENDRVFGNNGKIRDLVGEEVHLSHLYSNINKKISNNFMEKIMKELLNQI